MESPKILSPVVDYTVKVNGETWTEIPSTVYIPPAALKVVLQQFEGPLDLLLYLIKKQDLDILQIPIAEICEQYLDYIRFMQQLEFDLAAEYLTMAAWLTEIKSRLLLPASEVAMDEEEADPRAELIRQLQVYQQYKRAAEQLEQLPRVNRDIFVIQCIFDLESGCTKPRVTVLDLVTALQQLKRKQRLNAVHQVTSERISIADCMQYILGQLRSCPSKPIGLWQVCRTPTRLGLVATLVAALELTHQHLISIEQAHPFAEIWLSPCRTEEPTYC